MNIDAHGLQKQLIDTLKEDKAIVSSRVEAAFQHVPRHLFLRHLPPEQVYVNKTIPTKHSDTGEVISSASQPGVVAEILERLDVLPGHNVLEIGAGTGFNAALLANLVGQQGQVVSLDIDEDIVAGARDNLLNFGAANVRVELGDGRHGFEALAPYDRIVLSTSSLDVFPAWTVQLKEGGRLGLAMLFYKDEGTFVIFEKQGNHLRSCGGAGARFMPMRGGFSSESDHRDEQGDTALREWIKQGKMFSSILVYPKDAQLPKSDRQIVLHRYYASFVFRWD